MTRHVVVGTAGHIDHGKSSLVRALTGIDPDRLQEEKARGITIDLGFAHARIGEVRVAFVDVPGHERFVRNMLAGATGIDGVLLVVAADESVMPQTREHFDICRLLGVREGVIALTKADLADVDLRAVARAEVADLVAGSFLEHAPVVEVSATTGAGLEALGAALARLATRTASRSPSGPVRHPVDRAFTLRGFGTVVTGTIASGTIRVDAALELLPAGRPARVRGVHVHGAPVEAAAAGERAAVNLGDVPVSAVARGDVLATPGAFEATRRLDVRIELLGDAAPLRHGARVRVHLGTSEVMGRVALAARLGADAAEPPVVVAPGGRAHARLRVEAPLVAGRGDRFVLRTYSPLRTIGGGLVLDPGPRRGALRTDAARRRFAKLDPGMPAIGETAALERAVAALVDDRGRDGVRPPDLARRLGLDPARVQEAGAALVQAGQVVTAGDRWLDVATARRLDDDLVALVSTHHAAMPDSEGLPREEARDRLRVPPPVFDWLVAGLAAQGRLTGRERLAIPGRSGRQTEGEARLAERLEGLLRAAGLKALDEDALAAALGAPRPEVDRGLAWLGRQRRAVRVGGLPFHAEALQALKADVRALAQAAAGGAPPRIDVAGFKTRYDVSRKYAIPLLEYLDRERVTRRMGDVRIVL